MSLTLALAAGAVGLILLLRNGGSMSGDPVALSIPVLKELEGYSPTAYDDGPQQSIGYGSRVDPDTPAYLTRDASAALLEQRIRAEYYPAVQAEISGLSLSPAQVAALICATYNLGTGFMGWQWLTALKNGDIANARHRFIYYTHSNPTLHAALHKRRKKEWFMFRTGQWNPSAENLEESQLPL